MPFLNGFLISLGLILAIGAQNAFILRQGIRREHVFILCLICGASDALLIALGVSGLGVMIERAPMLLPAVTGFGIAFLLWYGWQALQRALHPQAAAIAETERMPLANAVRLCLALTFLNPHVYLDTVLLVGSLAAPYSGEARWLYGIGAASASFVWFFALGYGARVLTPLFQKPIAWRVLDSLIALTMFAIAAQLALWLSSRI